MRIRFIIILFLTVATVATGQTGFIYENEQLGVRFASTKDWTTERNHQSDTFILENKNRNIVLRIWHRESNADAIVCLEDLLLFEGLCKLGESYETVVDHKKATAIIAGYVKMHQPFRVILIAVKKNDGFDIISATCPEDCFLNHNSQMDELLSSFEFFNPEESSVYYTSRRKSG